MIGAQSDLLGMGTGGSESVAGEGSGSLTTQLSCRVRSMFGSIAAEGKASVLGSIHPSMDDTTSSELRVGAVPVRSPEHCSMVELNRAHRDRVTHKGGARIRRRSSLRRCRQCSLSFQTLPDGQGRSYQSAPDGQASWPVVRSRRTRKSARGERFLLGQRHY